MRAQSLDTPVSLLERIKAGDEDAWASLPGSMCECWRNGAGNWNIQNADSQDVIQETLLAVVLGVPKFERRSTGSFRAWMKTIAWRCWYDSLAKPPGAKIKSC